MYILTLAENTYRPQKEMCEDIDGRQASYILVLLLTVGQIMDHQYHYLPIN